MSLACPRPGGPVVAASVLSLLLLAACGDADDGPSATLRVVHVAPEIAALDVRFIEAGSGAEIPPVEGIAFREASPFRALAAATWRVEVVGAGTDGPPLAVVDALPLVEGTRVSLVVSEVALDGRGDDPFAFVVGDEALTPTPGRAAVRFVHAGVSMPDVRLFIDGELLQAGLPYRADVSAADLSPTAFDLGVDLGREPTADVSGIVQGLGRDAAVTGFLVRRPTEVPDVRAVELALFEPAGPLGFVPLE